MDNIGNTISINEESESKDYWNTLNPLAIPTNYPELRYKHVEDRIGSLEFDSEEFQSVYKNSDMETQKAMLNANNLSDALKIAERRSIFNNSQKAIENDSIFTQIGMGLAPALLSPSSVLPAGVVFKGAQVAKAVSRLHKGAQVAGAGAVTGGVANVFDEALFDLQGMPTNYLGAAGIGAAFGGSLGLVSGMLSGPTKQAVADGLTPERDNFSKEFDIDETITLDLDENGVPKLQYTEKMKESWIDKIPWLGDKLRSDVHKVLQGDSPLLRAFTLRMASPTVSQRDANGNLVPIQKTGMDFKRESKGLQNQLTKEVVQAYQEARKKGYDGNLDKFNEDIWHIYTKAMNEQRNAAHTHSKTINENLIRESEANKDKELLELEEEYFYYKDEQGRDVQVTETMFKDMEADRADADVYNKQMSEVNEYVDTLIKQYEKEGLRGKNNIKAKREEILSTISEQVPDKPIPRTISEDKMFKKKQYTKAELETKRQEVVDKYDTELETKLKEVSDEWYSNNKWEFSGDEYLVKGAERYRTYFQNMLKKSQDVGIKELKGLHANRIYSPRVYNYRGIHKGDVSQVKVREEVTAGLINDVRNKSLTKEQLEEAVDGIMAKLNSSAFDLNNLTTSFMVKDLPFSTHLQQKKLYLNEHYMPSILDTNLENISSAYHYKMSGRQATQYAFGTDQLDEIMDMVKKEHLDKGIIENKADIEAFERTVQDLLGTLRMNQLADSPSWTFTRNLTSFNSARLGGGFGGNQFIELVSSIIMNGIQSLMSGRLMSSLKNSADLLYTQSGKHDEFAEYLINSGFMEDALHTSRVNRYADTESGFNSGWLENKLNWINDKVMKYNGMRYFMGVMEDYTGAAIVTQLKTGKVEAKRLARWGLSVKDAENLGNKLKEVSTKDKWDLSKLSIKEQDQLQLAITRGIEEIVVQGESIHLPAWMKAPGQFTKVLTQFMRFPLVAQETLLRKGMTEEQAQMAAGTISSIMAFMGIKYLREQASIATGGVNPIDAKYDYENFSDEDYLRVIGEALNYTAPLGFMSAIWNYGAIATGNPELGREWQSKNGMMSLSGPSGGLGEDIIQTIRAGVNGEFASERQLKRWQRMITINAPIVKEGVDALIEDIARR